MSGSPGCRRCARPLYRFEQERGLGVCLPCFNEGQRRMGHLFALGSIAETRSWESRIRRRMEEGQ